MGNEQTGAQDEPAGARLNRMTMRSWRRGTKEMDLVLGPWADAHLAGLDEGRLTTYDALLAENHQDLMFPYHKQYPFFPCLLNCK